MKSRINGKSPLVYKLLAASFFPYYSFVCRFKNNGGNFHIKLPAKGKLIPNVSVPEDLVQIQAYLRWERKGKQMYNPKQEQARILEVLYVLFCNFFIQEG